MPLKKLTKLNDTLARQVPSLGAGMGLLGLDDARAKAREELLVCRVIDDVQRHIRRRLQGGASVGFAYATAPMSGRIRPESQ